MHQRVAAVCAGWAWCRLQRVEGNWEAFAVVVASDSPLLWVAVPSDL